MIGGGPVSDGDRLIPDASVAVAGLVCLVLSLEVMSPTKKKHSPVTFGIIGGVLGFVLTMVIALVIFFTTSPADPLMTTEQYGEEVGQMLAPVALILVGLLAFLGVRYAKKKNSVQG